jgi:hypothetical protein
MTIGDILDEFSGDVFSRDNETFKIFGELQQAVDAYRHAVETNTDINAKEMELSLKQAEFHRRTANFDRIFKRNERLAFSLLTNVANVSRREFNVFSSLNYSTTAEDILRPSFRKCMQAIYGLDSEEAKRVDFNSWYITKVLMQSAWNNTSGVPDRDQGSWLVRTAEMRDNQYRLAGTSGGSDVWELKAVSLPTRLEMIRVHGPGGEASRRSSSLLDVFEGAEPGEYSDRIRHRWERNLDKHGTYKINTEELRWNFLNNILNGIKLVDLVTNQQHLHLFEKVFLTENGVMKVDHAEVRKALGNWWNSARLTFNDNGIDYEKLIGVDGREMHAIEHMLGEKTLGILEVLRYNYEKNAEKFEGKNKEKHKKAAETYKWLAENIEKNPALAVLMNLVAAEIAEHMDINGPYDNWTLLQVSKIFFVLNEFLRQEMTPRREGGHGKGHEKYGVELIPFGVFDEILQEHGDSTTDMLFRAVLWGFLTALVRGSVQAMIEQEDEYFQANKTYIG